MSYEREPGGASVEGKYKNLLAGLSGVLSAKVMLDETDNIREIHVLASADRNVKQVVRDVRSALSSFFDIDVDHRVISVAQMRDGVETRREAGDGHDHIQPFGGSRGDPFRAEPPRAFPSYPESDLGVQIYPPELRRAASRPAAYETTMGRLKCGRISQTLEDDSYAVTITLKIGNRAYDGSCSCRNTEPQRMACVANAVISAVHNFLGRDALFRVVSVKRITSLPVPVCMVLVECANDAGSQMLVGATEIGADEAISVERATMDAINRKISALIEPTMG